MPLCDDKNGPASPKLPHLEVALQQRRGKPPSTRFTEERATDIDGSNALGPLAIACLAHDGKFPIGIESDYLPKHLLQHTWLGEFPT